MFFDTLIFVGDSDMVKMSFVIGLKKCIERIIVISN